MMSTARFFTVVALLALTGIACAGSIAEVDRPCPCADGWTCCAGANVCVAPGGACPGGAGLSGPGGAVPPVTLASIDGTAAKPLCFGQDAEHLYWLDGEGKLAAIAKGGGPVVRSRFEVPPQLMPEEYEGDGCTIAIDRNHLYATMFGLGKVLRVSIMTNGVWDLGGEGALIGPLTTPVALVVEKDAIYVAERDTGAITRISRSDDDAMGLDAEGAFRDPRQTSAFSVPYGVPPLARVGAHARSLLADETSLYWSDDGGIRKTAKFGGSVATLSTSPAPYLTLAAGHLYWASQKEGGIVSIPTTGGTPTVVQWQEEIEDCRHGNVVVATVGGVRAITAAGGDVFFADKTRVLQSPMASTTSTPVFSYRPLCGDAALDLRRLAVDDKRIYWADTKTLWSRPR